MTRSSLIRRKLGVISELKKKILAQFWKFLGRNRTFVFPLLWPNVAVVLNYDVDTLDASENPNAQLQSLCL